ncbi:DUF418 domain-containing protein [Nocardia sp. NPDC057353]|uniref:DUF418 domain-containing protein n=1 Tax=Nocardia sp. NPDC057353 TaxID=3346104 RepID=UPI0036334442
MTETDSPRRAPAAQPVHRLVALDVLRGIAILGTLGTNVWIFTDPDGLLGYLNGVGAAGWVERVLQQLAQGKFLGLLTVMFGVGLAIQQRSAGRGGRRWPGRYPVRAGLLFLDGVVNFVFLAEFDVLTGYALTGLIVAYLLATGERAQRRWLLGAAAVHVALLTLIAVALVAAGPAAPGAVAANPYADGSFLELAAFRLENALAFRAETLFILPLSIALFLLGARLFRAGVFEPEEARLRRRLLLLGFGVAAPIDLVAGVGIGGNAVLLTRYGTAPLVALGILALVAEFSLRRPEPGFAGRRMAEVGRTALSCYLLQNLLASALCYGWGLGLAARVDPGARVPFTVAVYLAVALAVVACAHLWLRRFARGPVEWLWHSGYRALTGER